MRREDLPGVHQNDDAFSKGPEMISLRTEWRTGADVSPLAVTETPVEVSIPYQPREPAIPISTHGQAHIRRDGSVGFDLRPDSEIYVGVYGFGAGEFNDDRWGLTVRDEMLAAKMGVEGGSILHYQKQPSGWRQWLEMTEQMRIANGTALARWEGPWSVPDDDFLGPDALAALIQEPGWEGYVQGWCDWRVGASWQRPRFVIYKDEVNLAFGGDPEDATHPLLSKLSPYGGIGKVVDVLRSASGCPVAPGMFGVGNEVPVNYSRWLEPKYSDFIAQYHQPNNIPAPWTGQTLRQAAETLKWAAKHRDPNRPLSLNYGLIVDYFIRDEQGKWFKQIAATDPKSIPAQLWVNIALGATILRGYALCSYDAREPSSNPAVHEYQQAVKPGDPEYYALLSSATLIKENADLLLGSDQPLPDAGPDFLCGHRAGPKGRIWWAVNLSETVRGVPSSAVPFEGKRTNLYSNGTQSTPMEHSIVPPNGVLVLTQRN
jgi:hypothetical protein